LQQPRTANQISVFGGILISILQGNPMKPSKLYEALHALIAERVPLHIWGACGVGKSQIVSQVASDLDYDFLDVRAVQLGGATPPKPCTFGKVQATISAYRSAAVGPESAAATDGRLARLKETILSKLAGCQRFHQALFGAEQRKGIQVVLIEQSKNLRSLTNGNGEFPAESLLTRPFLENQIITFKPPLIVEAQADSVLALLQDVSPMCLEVGAKNVYHVHPIS
jgi:hypothetical protein